MRCVSVRELLAEEVGPAWTPGDPAENVLGEPLCQRCLCDVTTSSDREQVLRWLRTPVYQVSERGPLLFVPERQKGPWYRRAVSVLRRWLSTARPWRDRGSR